MRYLDSGSAAMPKTRTIAAQDGRPVAAPPVPQAQPPRPGPECPRVCDRPAEPQSQIDALQQQNPRDSGGRGHGTRWPVPVRRQPSGPGAQARLGLSAGSRPWRKTFPVPPRRAHRGEPVRAAPRGGATPRADAASFVTCAKLAQPGRDRWRWRWPPRMQISVQHPADGAASHLRWGSAVLGPLWRLGCRFRF